MELRKEFREGRGKTWQRLDYIIVNKMIALLKVVELYRCLGNRITSGTSKLS